MSKYPVKPYTVREYARAFRKELDANAFARAAAEFFDTEKFWDIEIDKNGEVFIEAASLITQARRELQQENTDIKNLSESIGYKTACQNGYNFGTEQMARLNACLVLYAKCMLGWNFIAYMTVYFEVEFSDRFDYATITIDFHKPITEKFMQELKQNIGELLSKTNNQPVINVRTISQEEYDERTQ